MVHMYLADKDENFDWVFSKFPDVRLIIHGHVSNVPCTTPDGCFEYSRRGFLEL